MASVSTLRLAQHEPTIELILNYRQNNIQLKQLGAQS